MLARHITHPSLGNTEYYFVMFRDQKDIDDFCKKCPWFEVDDAGIGEQFVIEYHTDPDWYEIFTRTHFRNKINEKISVYNSIAMEFANFFQG